MSDTVNSLFKGIGGAVRSLKDGYNKNFVQIQTSTVLETLKTLELKKSACSSEKKLEDLVLKHLNEHIGKAHPQYNIGGYLGLKIDIDLGDGQVGVELKLAKELLGMSSASNIERLFGQVIYYGKRKYKEKLIVAVAGTEAEYNQVMKEVEKFTRELNVEFHYIVLK